MGIVVDGRWRAQHGIGRYATEIISRLSNVSEVRNVASQ